MSRLSRRASTTLALLVVVAVGWFLLSLDTVDRRDPVVSGTAFSAVAERSAMKRDDALTRKAAAALRVARKVSSKRVREASRLQFADLGSRRALRAVAKAHPSVVVHKAGRGPQMRKNERIVKYVTPTSALISRGDGKSRAMVDSIGEPIAGTPAASGRGDLRSLDLGLSTRLQ